LPAVPSAGLFGIPAPSLNQLLLSQLAD